MGSEVELEKVISIPDIRYPGPTGAQYYPGLAFSGKIVLSGCIKLRIPAHDFGE
jgi:hypothetical protein